MRMNRLAFATLVAMGMTAAAIAQQPSQQTTPRSTQPQTQPTPPRNSQPAPGSRSTQDAPAPRGGDRTEQLSFERADKNADGQVSRQEANAIEGFDFSRADTNNDSSLSRQEYQAAMATSTPRNGPAARNESSGSARSGQSSSGAGGSASARSGGPQSDQSGGGSRSQRDENPGDHTGQGQQRSAQVSFDTADKDKDGKITRQEATDVPGLNFSSADTNADASLSRQEFQTAMAGAQPRG
jgi:EF hand domain-containing protein